MNKINAILFDFDGVIADSERLHWAAFNRVLNPRGRDISWEEYMDVFIGFDDRDAFRHALPKNTPDLNEMITEKAAAFQDLLATGDATALPGVVELIQSLSGKLPIGICSGALREDILPILGSLGLENAFDTIVTAEDTPVSKPDPAPFSKGWKNLREKFQTLETPGDVLAIEDTPAGIESAKGAGLRVLAVTNSYPAEYLTGADYIADTLEGLDVQSLS